MPVDLSVRVISTVPGWRCSSSGATSSSHMRFISAGGPGMAMMILPSFSTHQPGAVPRGLLIARAEGMSQACFLLRSGMLVWPRRANRRSQHFELLGVDRRRLAHDRGDALARQVVFGRPQTAREDDEVGVVARAPDRLGQTPQVVADDVLVVDVDAQRRQPRSDVRGVRVDDFAQEDFGTNGDDFSLHGRSMNCRVHVVVLSWHASAEASVLSSRPVIRETARQRLFRSAVLSLAHDMERWSEAAYRPGRRSPACSAFPCSA